MPHRVILLRTATVAYKCPPCIILRLNTPSPNHLTHSKMMTPTIISLPPPLLEISSCKAMELRLHRLIPNFPSPSHSLKRLSLSIVMILKATLSVLLLTSFAQSPRRLQRKHWHSKMLGKTCKRTTSARTRPTWASNLPTATASAKYPTTAAGAGRRPSLSNRLSLAISSCRPRRRRQLPLEQSDMFRRSACRLLLDQALKLSAPEAPWRASRSPAPPPPLSLET